MKKSFKTIMALTTALAISMSGISMTSADEDPTPPPTTQSVVDEDGDGIFDSSPSIPVTMGTEHILSVTIDFGDMAISYDFTDTSVENGYGWGESFVGTNAKFTVTNNSTCPVDVKCYLNIDTKTYPCLEEPGFRFASFDKNIFFDTLSYADDQTQGARKSVDMYLTINNTYEITGMHNYNFNNAKIGTITITLEPMWQTL